MNPRYAEALWCPICDVPSEECVQPEGEEQEDGDGAWMFVYWVEGHAAQWITMAERKADEALENLSTNRSALECTEAPGANAD